MQNYREERDDIMLKNMKIGKKLIFTYVLVVLISGIGCILSLIAINDINTKYSLAIENYGFSQGDIGKFNSEFNNSRSSILMILNGNDKQLRDNNIALLNQMDIKINTYLANIKKNITNSKETLYYNQIYNSLTKYLSIKNQVVALASQNKSVDAQNLYSEQLAPLSEKFLSYTGALYSEKDSVGDQVKTALSNEGILINIVILIVIFISIIISLTIAILISRSISKPVKEMEAAAQRMAEGDLSVEISVNSKNEIGLLGAAFKQTIELLKEYIYSIKETLAKLASNDLNISIRDDFKGDFEQLKYSLEGIVSSLNNTFIQINQAAHQVAGGSEQVSNGAQALSQGALEQASSIEMLDTQIAEISNDINQNAQHAREARKNVDSVKKEIDISNQQMSKMVEAMSSINASSNEIGKIIKTIDDIAFQTNILALNAAVEAARAGEAGKGFAVVADEVRNLAIKSAQAAKNTSVLITNSIDQINNGTKIADKTAQSLSKVVASTSAVFDLVDQISRASTKQSGAVSQVIREIGQISNVVQTNSASAEESAAASEELSGQADSLKQLISRFKLREQA
jgi:Methyl-accepting chemotaxis protein